MEDLLNDNIDLITTIRSTMKPHVLSLIEIVKDQLKNISQIQHICYRSLHNFFVNVMAGLQA